MSLKPAYIPYGHQSINSQDVETVIETLKSEWLTQGPAVERFEQTVADYCGSKYAIAVANATAALHLACLAADLKPGQVLWTSPNTFVASANCGRYCGADVDFVDIDPKTYNLSVPELEKKLRSSSRKPSVVVPVHFAGQSCDMRSLGVEKRVWIHSDRRCFACHWRQISGCACWPLPILRYDGF